MKRDFTPLAARCFREAEHSLLDFGRKLREADIGDKRLHDYEAQPIVMEYKRFPATKRAIVARLLRVCCAKISET